MHTHSRSSVTGAFISLLCTHVSCRVYNECGCKTGEKVKKGGLEPRSTYFLEGPSTQPFVQNYFTISFAVAYDVNLNIFYSTKVCTSMHILAKQV